MRSASRLICALVTSLVTVGWVCLAAEAQSVAQVRAPAAAKSGIAFQMIDGAENRTLDILDKRKAEIVEKKGGKLSGHDWWLWGLTGIDYDRDGDTDLIVTIHGPAGHGDLPRFLELILKLGVDWQLPSAGRTAHFRVGLRWRRLAGL